MSQFSDNGGTPGSGSKPASPLQAALTEAVAAFSRDPSGAVRRLLDSTERALAGVAGASGGREAVAGVVSRLLSDLQPPAAGRGGEAAAKPPGGGSAGPSAGARQGGDARAAPYSVPAALPPMPFVGLRQPGESWSFHVRAAAVEAVAPAGEAACVLHLSDGSAVEAGQCSDTAARQLPGLARLSQVGTQRGRYVRPEAVLAVAAPAAGGCVLRLRGGRELTVAEAAAVAVGLLAGGER